MSKRLKKYTIKEVKKIFEDGGCILLSKIYKNGKEKLDYICVCENQAQISLFDFKRGRRCYKCAAKRRAKKLRYTYKDVKKIFKKGGCKLISKKYINCDTKLKYKCNCGRTAWITLYHFKKGQRCRKCSGKEKLTFKEVKQYFKDHDCKLLEKEYKNVDTSMEYECKCGNSNCKITFKNFKKGQRCKKCAIERISGKNNYNYNPNLTDEEREKGRNCPGLGKWRKDVCERDNFSCQDCGETEGKLCAHHIEAYTPNKELRTVLSNGIIFCEEHHINFHKIYGYNCHREQLEEFIKIGVA